MRGDIGFDSDAATACRPVQPVKTKVGFDGSLCLIRSVIYIFFAFSNSRAPVSAVILLVFSSHLCASLVLRVATWLGILLARNESQPAHLILNIF